MPNACCAPAGSSGGIMPRTRAPITCMSHGRPSPLSRGLPPWPRKCGPNSCRDFPAGAATPSSTIFCTSKPIYSAWMRRPDAHMKIIKCSLLLLAAALPLAGCKPSSAAPKAAGPPPPVPVQVAVTQQLDVPRIIQSVGVVQALRTVAVKSQVDGMIAEIHFREGDEVKAGDLLVT